MEVRERFEGATLLALKMENGVPKPRNAGGLQKPGKGKETGSPLEPLEGAWLC